MDWAALIDPQSAALVLGGTTLATVLRSGRSELAATGHMLGQMVRPAFNYAAARAEIAKEVAHIKSDGVLRATGTRSSDSEFIDVTDALIRHRSIDAMIQTHIRHKHQRQRTRTRAVWTLSQAGELAPVFGMAGTLFGLSQIPTGDIASDGLFAAVATAIVTTLYGLLAAHMVFLPLARWAVRRGENEEEQRQHLIDWLAAQLSSVCPSEAKLPDQAARA